MENKETPPMWSKGNFVQYDDAKPLTELIREALLNCERLSRIVDLPTNYEDILNDAFKRSMKKEPSKSYRR